MLLILGKKENMVGAILKYTDCHREAETAKAHRG